MPVNSFDNYPMSWRPSLPRGSKPLYISLSKQLEQDIFDGVLLPGTRLPPQRELADYLDINVSTVSRALKICSRKGLLVGNIGSGTYVAYDISTNLLATPAVNKPHLIELGSMVPETIQQKEVTALLRKMMMEPDFGRLFQYSLGIADWQQEAAAKLMSRVGCPASSGQILVASGGQNSLAAVFSGVLQPGDRLGVDPLVYPGVKSAAKLFGIQLVPIVQERNEMSEDGLRYAIKNAGIKAIYVMPENHNPTTHIMTAECREMIARVAKEFDLLIIEDGITGLLQNKPKRSVFSHATEHTVYILSLSKSVNPALRLAYLAIPSRYHRSIANALYNINLSQSALLMELASRLIVSGELESLLNRRRKGLKLRNRLTDRVLSDYEVWGNETSLSRWLILPPHVTGIQFEQLALEHGVVVYGSEHFAVGKEAPVCAVRLAVCAPDPVGQLEQGLTILKDLLGTL